MKINPVEIERVATGAVIGIVFCAIAAVFHPHPMAFPFAVFLTVAAAILAAIVLIWSSIAHTRAREAAKRTPVEKRQAWERVSLPPHIHPGRNHMGRLAEIISLPYRSGWIQGTVALVVLEGFEQAVTINDSPLLLCRPFGEPDGQRRWIPAFALSIASEGRTDPVLLETTGVVMSQSQEGRG